MTCRDREDRERDLRVERALERIELIATWTLELADRTLKQQEKLMGATEDIAAAVAALQADETGLDASVQAIQAEIANLTSAGVDTTALNAEVANLASHVASVAALAPPAG